MPIEAVRRLGRFGVEERRNMVMIRVREQGSRSDLGPALSINPFANHRTEPSFRVGAVPLEFAKGSLLREMSLQGGR